MILSNPALIHLQLTTEHDFPVVEVSVLLLLPLAGLLVEAVDHVGVPCPRVVEVVQGEAQPLTPAGNGVSR